MTLDKRKELLTKAKSIRFDTEMVRAILDGRKTVTRRLVKPQPNEAHDIMEYDDDSHSVDFLCGACGADSTFIDWAETVKAPYWFGDILYAKETWCKGSLNYGIEQYYYKADDKIEHCRWQPSTRMPKEAARIFLKVTNVRVERLQDIDDDGVASEGLEIGAPFDDLWNSTVKKKDLGKYGWDANPWVWVIEFERMD